MAIAAPILGNIALNLAISVGASLLAGLLKPKQETGSSATTSKGVSFDLSLGENVPLFAIWGRGRTAGHLVFAQEYGDDNEYLKIVITQGKGTYDAFETFLVDEKVASLSGSNSDTDGFVVNPFRLNADGEVDEAAGEPYMWIKTYDGSPGQVVDPGLQSAANPGTRWGSLHTLTRTPYVVITMRYSADLYGGALPTFGFVWRGLKLYDWRKDSTVPGGSGSHRWADQTTWEWTENPHVIAYNWRRGYWINGIKVFGFGFSATSCDLSYFTAGANVSDESVDYPETVATLARYAFGREIGDDEDRLDVQKEFEASWCGSSFSRGGAYAPVQSQTQVPVLTLYDTDRLQGYSVRADLYGTVSSKKTAWHGQYISAADGWQQRPYARRYSSELAALIGGERTAQFDQNFEHRVERAQMRAEISLRRGLFPASRTETFGPRAIVLEPGDCITRDCEWGAMRMIVDATQRLPHNMGVTLTLTEWSNSIVPASDEAFIDVPPSAGTPPSSAQRTLTISGLSCGAYAIEGTDAILPGARASWTPISDPNVTQVLIRYWPSAGSEALDGQDVFASAPLQSAKIFGPLADLTLYSVKAMPVRSDGRTTTWSNTVTFTSGATSVPAEVADGSITVDKLGQELLNTYGIVSSDAQGSLIDQLQQIQDLVEQLALTVVTNDQRSKQNASILRATLGTSNAAIIRTEYAIVEEAAARAQAIEEVLASVGDVIADGFLRFEAEVDGLNATSTITAKVKATSGSNFSEAAWILKAEADGFGGSQAYFGVLGNFYVFETVDGEPIAAFGVQDGRVKFHRQESFATTVGGTPIVILDGDTGDFSITVNTV